MKNPIGKGSQSWCQGLTQIRGGLRTRKTRAKTLALEGGDCHSYGGTMHQAGEGAEPEEKDC